MTCALFRLHRAATLRVFLALWLAFGALIDMADLRSYTLQQAGAAALVEEHTFALWHSAHPLLRPLGDVFKYDGRVLAVKQPGQFVFGAMPYALLHAAGWNYERDYDLVSALVTWLSASLLAALALALLWRRLQQWGFAASSASLAIAAVAFGSPWFAYAGIAHHDVLAGSLLLLGLLAADRAQATVDPTRHRWTFGAGLLLGLTIFTSMLPALPVATLGLALAARGLRSSLYASAGFTLGILPLLMYNAWYFGSPWMPANIAIEYRDTVFAVEAARLRHHLNAYLGSGGLALWKYAPLLTLGILGWLRLPPRLGALRWAMPLAAALHVGYLTGIQTQGSCSYGPRYLLPLLPWLAIGLAALVDRSLTRRLDRTQAMRIAIIAGLSLLLTVSLAINAIGALAGTMYCDLERFAFLARWQTLADFSLSDLPLLWICAGLAVLWATIEAVLVRQRHGASQKKWGTP